MPNATVLIWKVLRIAKQPGEMWLISFLLLVLAAGHGPHDQKRLGPRRDRVGQRGVR